MRQTEEQSGIRQLSNMGSSSRDDDDDDDRPDFDWDPDGIDDDEILIIVLVVVLLLLAIVLGVAGYFLWKRRKERREMKDRLHVNYRPSDHEAWIPYGPPPADPSQQSMPMSTRRPPPLQASSNSGGPRYYSGSGPDVRAAARNGYADSSSKYSQSEDGDESVYTEDDEGASAAGRGPYSGSTAAHRWVPPIHKMEPPPDYGDHERHWRF